MEIWNGRLCELDPGGCWIDDLTDEHVNAFTNKRTKFHEGKMNRSKKTARRRMLRQFLVREVIGHEKRGEVTTIRQMTPEEKETTATRMMVGIPDHAGLMGFYPVNPLMSREVIS